MSFKLNRCANKDCKISTGICGSLTFGSGELDDLGYWQKPCKNCAAAWKNEFPNDDVLPNQ